MVGSGASCVAPWRQGLSKPPENRRRRSRERIRASATPSAVDQADEGRTIPSRRAAARVAAAGGADWPPRCGANATKPRKTTHSAHQNTLCPPLGAPRALPGARARPFFGGRGPGRSNAVGQRDSREVDMGGRLSAARCDPSRQLVTFLGTRRAAILGAVAFCRPAIADSGRHLPAGIRGVWFDKGVPSPPRGAGQRSASGGFCSKPPGQGPRGVPHRR